MQKCILMVCLGNICRSPTAQGVMEYQIKEAGLQNRVFVDSAGTGDWHIGRAPDNRSAEAALRRGYDLSHLSARQVDHEDFERFDYLLAMDRSNRDDLIDIAPASQQHKISLLLEYAGYQDCDVPDPYYGGEQGFEHVLDLVEEACAAFLQRLRTELE